MTATINNQALMVKEYQNQRVVTFSDIDRVHERPDGTAKRNFRNNKEHFIEGEDYFNIAKNQKDEIRTLEIPNRGIIVLTEFGYLLLVKSLSDNLAWKVQRELVKSYFRVKQNAQQLIPTTPQTPLIQPQNPILEQSIYHLQQSTHHLTQCAMEHGYQLDRLSNQFTNINKRLEKLEYRPKHLLDLPPYRNPELSPILQLIKKRDDNSNGGTATYRAVYSRMATPQWWSEVERKYRRKYQVYHPKKVLKSTIVNSDVKYRVMFNKTVQRMLDDIL